MPDGPHRIDWEWEEIVLACDLVAQNGWRQLDASDPRVRELSGLLQRMSMHPLQARLPSFRNPAGVARKTYNIATVHPDYVGPRVTVTSWTRKFSTSFSTIQSRCTALRRVCVGLRSGTNQGTSRNLSAT